MELQKGRPTDESRRTEKELRTYDLLDALQVPFDRIDHDPAMTMEACADADKVLHAMICKNLFLCNRQKTRFFLLLIPDAKRFVTKELSARLGTARLSFADAEHMNAMLNATPGSVSVMGLQYDEAHAVTLVIDRAVMDAEWFACHPCINTSSIRFRMTDFRDKVLPALGHDPIYVDLPEE